MDRNVSRWYTFADNNWKIVPCFSIFYNCRSQTKKTKKTSLKQRKQGRRGNQVVATLRANPNANFHIRRHGSVRVLTTKQAKKKKKVWERRRQKFGIGKPSGVTTRVISQIDLSPHQRQPAAMTLLPHYQPRLCPQEVNKRASARQHQIYTSQVPASNKWGARGQLFPYQVCERGNSGVNNKLKQIK